VEFALTLYYLFSELLPWSRILSEKVIVAELMRPCHAALL
jgi:hypothetical protein